MAPPLPCSGRRRAGDAGGAGGTPGRRPAPAPVAVVAVTCLLLDRDPEIALDLGDDALLRVEELRRHVGPATQVLDGEEAGGGREVLPRGVSGLGHRAVAVLGEDLLALVRADEVQEGLGLLRV